MAVIYLGGSWAALRVTLRNFFRPVVTESRWDQAARPHENRSERYRASFALVHDAHGDAACIGCKICEAVCPSSVITVTAGEKRESPNTGKKRAWADDFVLDLQGCIYCELCVQVCPTDSIVMRRVQEVPGFERDDLVLTMERLYANEHEKPATWANGSKLREMQDPKRPVTPAAQPLSASAPPAPAAEEPR